MSEHAISNAEAWITNIVETIAALAAAEASEMAECSQCEGIGEIERMEDAESIRERIQEEPLCIEIRSDWHSPGDPKPLPGQYLVLLSTGGPALRIFGELDDYSQPDDWPHLQWQNWGTPWTDYDLTEAEREALTAYARQFYYGEG